MKLEEHRIESRSGEYSRKVWLLQAAGNGRPERIGVFLDGEYYVERMGGPATLLDLHTRGVIPPMTCVFVSHVNGEARHHDLTCNPRYAEFIAVDVIQWLRQRDESLPENGHLIAGTSLSGLEAAYVALAYPKVFSSCLSHSGSFWWRDEWLTGHLDSMTSSQGKFWISVGDKERQIGLSHPPTGLRQDVAQVDACERFAEALKQRGHAVHYHLHEGGHDPKAWGEELPEALAWLHSPTLG